MADRTKKIEQNRVSETLTALNREDRMDRATKYYHVDLQGKPKRYSEHANSFRLYSQFLSLVIILAGALTAFLGVFAATTWVSVTTAFLGSVVAIVKGWEHIARYEDTWISHRIASERLWREFRLYVNGADCYRDVDDEDRAYVHFVEEVETIIEEEQRMRWSNKSGVHPNTIATGGNVETAPE